ncbi:protein phosphatase 1 regulatory subunit 12A-like isoform X3 [Homarus americanus]|uniref:protein phosphatase 1 regulatory subunit 12A-like isoform X3 n=1 Tax=Homarus americanus TaxID=6706 RepID=UPI001C471168|nr:protein phosphatase 1 regulatory subunit 12A-like isoform X3 [Homarus americanus]
MAVDNRSTSALFKRAEQLRRWQESETNKQEVYENSRSRKVNFSDGCIFLAACAAGDKQEVLRLLEKGADIDTANVDGLTALHAACIDDNLDMVEFLVDQGTDVNRGDMEGWTPLHATASCGFNSIAKFLIDRGADLSLVNNDGDLAIDIADSDEMESLLQREIEDRGIDCDASRNEEERRMLEDAQSWLSNGYLADRPHPKTGAVALHVAAAKGYNKVMNLLIEAGADINSQDMDGWTPLHAAAHWGQRDAVEILCENNADMDVRNFVGQSAFDVADNNLLRLMDELKRKQAAQKLVKPAPRKRKTSPHREHSNKKEREDQRESDGTSGDESSSDVEDEESSEETTSSESSDSSESDSEEEEEKEKEKEKEEEDKEEEEEEEKSILGSYTRALSPLKYLVEKKNKVNKENATPQIIPTSVVTEKSNSRTLPQARADNTMDESEVQSWRRPSSLRKTNQEDKNQKEEVSRTIPTPARVSNRESEDTTTGKRVTPAEKDESSLSATRERLKARSCPALSQLEEEGGRDGGGGVRVTTRSQSRSGGIASSSAALSSPSSLATCQRLSSSDINLPSVQNHPNPLSSPSLFPVPNNQSATTTPTYVAPVTTHPSSTVSSTNLTTAASTIPAVTPPVSSSIEANNLLTTVTTATTTITTPTSPSETQTTTTCTTPHRPLGPSISSPASPVPILTPPPPPLQPPIPPSVPPSSSTTVITITTTTTTTAGLASLSTNQTTNNKDPRLLARSASLRERIQRNHMDSMEPLVSTSTVLTTNTSPSTRSIGSNVTTLTTNGGLTALPPPPKTAPTLSIPPKQPNQQHLPSPTATTSLPIVTVTPQTPPTSPTPSTPPPPQTPSSAQPPTPSKMSPGSVIKNFFKSFVPPSRDEESETQRKAHAKMVRSTRRSTQGVTLEDIKSAEQFMKNKQQQVSTSSPEPKETSSASTVPTSTPQGSSTTTPSSPSSKPKPESPTKADEEERRPSWRLKVDDADKNRFSLENVRSKDKAEVENDTETVTVQLRRKNTEEKADEDKESERNSQTREGTQAAIQRRKKPKRRSTGRVQVNIDDIDPEKRAQRSAEQQQQADEGSEEEEEEEKPVSVRDDNVTVGRCCLRESVNERGDTVKGSTTSLGSAINSQPSSRSSSIGPENGDIDYKKLYEEQLEENFKVRERLRGTETELRQSREAVDLNTKKCNTRLAMAEADKREKRALERKLSEMEEELKQLQKLKAENEKLRAENRALTRVVSKLTNSATAGMGNLANLSK